MSPFKVVIPARLASERLPEKALREIDGRPLILHVWERAQASNASEVLVATDDERIAKVVERAGGQAILTASHHASGTDRLAEVVRTRGWPDDTIVVNLQGDEPLVPPALLDDLGNTLGLVDAGIVTAATPIRDGHELFDPNVVKVVLDDQGFALYFSRAPIPWVRNSFSAEPPQTLPSEPPFFRHLGLYAYRAGTLQRFCTTPASALERAESLEQLRALALGIRIYVRILDQGPPPGVDTEADLERVQRLMRQR